MMVYTAFCTANINISICYKCTENVEYTRVQRMVNGFRAQSKEEKNKNTREIILIRTKPKKKQRFLFFFFLLERTVHLGSSALSHRYHKGIRRFQSLNTLLEYTHSSDPRTFNYKFFLCCCCCCCCVYFLLFCFVYFKLFPFVLNILHYFLLSFDCTRF